MITCNISYLELSTYYRDLPILKITAFGFIGKFKLDVLE